MSRARLLSQLRPILLVSLFVVAGASGCDCDGAQVGEASTGVTLVEPAGKADAFERTIDFGAVRVGSLQRRRILLRNDGVLPATITRAEITEQTGDFFLGKPVPLPRLESKGELAMEIRYVSSEIGADSATIVIETDIQDTPKYTIKVLGRGAAPEIDVCATISGSEVCADTAPDGRLTIDFGQAALDERTEYPITVRNRGDAQLSVVGARPDDQTTSELTVEPGDEAVEVPAQGAKTYKVVYTPLDGGPDEGVIEIVSDDPDEATVKVYVKAFGRAPALCVSPLVIDFGAQPTGVAAKRTLTLLSCGAEPVQLSAFSVFAGDRNVFAVTNPPAAPVTLAVGQQVELEVTYTPNSLLPDEGKINLTTTAPRSRGFVTLLGGGAGCALSVVPASVNFGQVSQGGRTTRQVQLRNVGTSDCIVTEFRSPAAPFAIDAPPTVPLTIGAGQASSMTVAFAPTAAGAASGKAQIVVNSGGGTVDVPLNGAGIAAPPCDLQAQPQSMLFSGISPGQSSSQNLVLKNFGTKECYITKSEIIPPAAPFTATAGGFPPQSIQPGGQASVPVKFSPVAGGVQRANLRITYGDQAGFPGPFPIPGGNTRTLDVALEGGALEPAICLDPPELNFGAVPPNQQTDLTFNIRSCGQGALTVRGLTFRSGSSTDFSFVAPPRVPIFLQPTQVSTIKVRYKPGTTAPDFGTIDVLNNDPARGVAEVKVRGNAANVCDKQLACALDRLRFPTTETGANSSMTVVCQNVGTQNVQISAATLAAGTSSEFRPILGRLPATVAPGRSFRMEVRYEPTNAGTDTGTIRVTSDSCVPVEVAVDGAGKAPNYPKCLAPQTFQPVQKWAWSGGSTETSSKNIEMAPIVINTNDDNGDGRIDQEDIPDVLFTSCKQGECCIRCFGNTDFKTMDLAGKGMLRAVDGKFGRDLWSVTDPALALAATNQLAAGDIDGDNIPEIIAVKHHFQPGSGSDGMTGKYAKGTLLVFDNTGRLKFETEQWAGDPNATEQMSAPTLGDLDGDGSVEIFFDRTVFKNNGQKLFDLANTGNDGKGAFVVQSDLDNDGVPEILTGKYTYRANGALMWTASTRWSGAPMILEVDGDGKPDVVLRDSAISLRVLDALTGVEKSKVEWDYPKNAEGGNESICAAPTAAADLDGDGKPEFIVPSGDRLLAIKTNGTIMWQAPISDYGGQCGAAGAAAFDFEGDGKFEVVYHDTSHTWIFRGTDGTKLFDAPRNSSTLWETPVIADIDNDGHADIVTTNENGILGIGSNAGVIAWSNTGNNWPTTRRIWNQHTYHVSDVNENGSIPRVEVPSWKSTNSWRANHPRCTP